MKTKLPVALSNRHMHVSKKDAEVLFGKNCCLTELKPLSQPDQYACEEKVDLEGPKGSIKGVRLLGPFREETQVEVSFTDARALGVKAPLANSGELEGTPGIKIIGPKGTIELENGVIVAARHIHFSPEEAREFGVEDYDVVKVKTSGPRAVIFENTLVRVSPAFKLEMHVDLDEGNAAGLSNGDIVEIVK